MAGRQLQDFLRPEQTGEDEFLAWYEQIAKDHGYDPDPDDPSHFYDYRAAFRDGVRGPDQSGHWPSRYKDKDHPNRVVGGFDTLTTKRVPGTRRASEAELIELQWDPATARRLAMTPEPQYLQGTPGTRFVGQPYIFGGQ